MHKPDDTVQLWSGCCDAAGCTDLHFQQQWCCRVAAGLPGLDLPGTVELAPLHSPAEGKSTCYTETQLITVKKKECAGIQPAQ